MVGQQGGGSRWAREDFDAGVLAAISPEAQDRAAGAVTRKILKPIQASPSGLPPVFSTLDNVRINAGLWKAATDLRDGILALPAE